MSSLSLLLGGNSTVNTIRTLDAETYRISVVDAFSKNLGYEQIKIAGSQLCDRHRKVGKQ
jgi:hypothetical protein